MEKNLNHKHFGKVMEISYNHMFTSAEFTIIHMFFLKKRSKKRTTFSKLFMFILRFLFGRGHVV